MTDCIYYKNYLLRGESFQSGSNFGWIARYALTRRDNRNQWNGSCSHYDRLDHVFWTEADADKFALQEGMRSIDEQSRLPG